jgi:hypothetical protein
MSITIDQALIDPKLLGSALGSIKTWETWLVALKAAFGIILNREERRAFASIAGSRKPPEQKVSEFWCCIGRGSGKSRMAAAIACFVSCFLPHKLDAGEVGFVLVLAASMDQARRVFDYAIAFLNSSPILCKMVKGITASEIRLSNNVVIACHSNSFRNIRGKSLLAVVADEISFWRDEDSANPDLEVYRAAKPSLIRCGGQWIAISSPYRRGGLLYAKFQRHFDRDDDDVLIVRGASVVFNPTLDEAKIAKELADDPEGARAEWEAEFRSGISTLFDEQVIEDAVNHARPLELPPRSGFRYRVFVDASAGRNDAFTICIGHTEGKGDAAIWVCDVIRGRPAPFNPSQTAGEFALLAREYGCRTITGDAFAGEWTAQAFRDCGCRYETSPLNKSALYLESLAYFNRGAARLPEHDLLLRELRLLERRVQRSGRDSVDHPKGHGSDDLANSACGCLYLCMHDLHKPKVRTGTYMIGGEGVLGRVHWKDDKVEPLRLRHVTYAADGTTVLKEETRVLPRDPKWLVR